MESAPCSPRWLPWPPAAAMPSGAAPLLSAQNPNLRLLLQAEHSGARFMVGFLAHYRTTAS